MTNSKENEARVTARFLSFAKWKSGDVELEIASRARLDTRQVVPYFHRDGVLWTGALERERVSRSARGAPLIGLEPIGIDFSHVDETGEILEYGKAIFTEHAGVNIDERALKIPLPTMARSIGYLTELALPLLVAVEPPASDDVSVTWDGATHTVRFRPLTSWLTELTSGTAPFSEDLALLFRALSPPQTTALPSDENSAVTSLLSRESSHVWDDATLAAHLETSSPDSLGNDLVRAGATHENDLRFLSFQVVTNQHAYWEFVTPGSGISFAALPYVVSAGHAYFLLWTETRVAALERKNGQPIYDTILPARYLNATAAFLPPSVIERLRTHDSPAELRRVAESVLTSALGKTVRAEEVTRVTRAAEPAPSISSELRHRVLVRVDPTTLGTLPEDVCIVRDDVLARAVSEGKIHDPVIVLGLLELAIPGCDPFAEARSGSVTDRLRFLESMTAGSTVQRRLRTYSSIESEQLGSATYAKLMTLLQHEYGVRVAYPKTEADRTFFKAAFRVFMASDRDENRALQGLHWSHDAYHFALGNFTLPAMPDFDAWYDSGDPIPNIPDDGELFSNYVTALKAAEDEATFFSFWTLFSDKPSLTSHVGQLTYWEATQKLGVRTRAEARAIFDDVTTRATLPSSISNSPVYQADEVIRKLFDYMLGFRDYHHKDIRAAWQFASREPYRGYFLRYGIYEHDLTRYVAHAKAFPASLEAISPGLNPLLAALADVRVAHLLRVWDVVKSMKLVRSSKLLAEAQKHAIRRDFRRIAESFFLRLDHVSREMAGLRASITNAEIVPKNERTFRAIGALGESLETLRSELWDAVAKTEAVDAATLVTERGRELPR